MEISAADMMKFAVENGIITSTQVQSLHTQMEKEERQKLLDQHPYKIYEGKDRKFYCYIKEGDKRKKIKRNSRKEIEDIIIENVKKGKEITIQDVFNEYLELKAQNGLKQATIDRYKACFKRHYIATSNHTKNIKKLSPEFFSDFIESEVGRCKLTSKGISNLKGITAGLIKRARRNHLIDYGSSAIFDDLDCKPFQRHIENDKQIFTEAELPKLIQYLIDNPDVHNLAILLMIVSGIRCGELVTLKFSDFISDTVFEVKRTETRVKAESGYECLVANAPKTIHGFRKVIIPDSCSWIIKELRHLRPFAEYLCTNEQGERMTTNAIRKRLYRVCDWLGFDYRKSPHKCRKTYCSILLDNGLDDNFVTSQVGHADPSTTKIHYHFDRKSESEKQERINKILEFKIS